MMKIFDRFMLVIVIWVYMLLWMAFPVAWVIILHIIQALYRGLG